ncbi:MAG: OB-fold nucleic acid binding domain-containing protein, partial [Candidatus Saccharibacteria bacterium]
RSPDQAGPSLSEKFWSQLEEFANYCFNKSHAACYGLIAYWTAYLKAHYPDAFMAALMTSDQDDIDRLAIEITECKHMGIDVLAPDINESFVEFAVVPEKKQIRFGMAAIKGVGTGMVEEVLRVREDGKFKNIEDFARRVSTQKINKKAWDSLIKSGAFDAMGDRSDILFNLENIQGFASKLQKEALSGQTDLFGGMSDVANIQPNIQMAEAPVKHTMKERLTWERELLGLYISAHPLDSYDAYFEEQTIALSRMKPEIDGRKITIGGLISTVRTIVTKTGSKMAFVGIEDKTGEGEIVVFPNLYAEIGAKLVQDAVIRATGKVSAKDRDGNVGEEAKLIADEIQIVTDKELREYESIGKKMEGPRVSATVRAQRVAAKVNSDEVVVTVPSSIQLEVPLTTKLFVHIKNPDDHDALLNLKKTCSEFPGTQDIVLVLGADKKSAIKLPFKIDSSDALVARLVKLLGEDSVVLK